MIANKNVGEDGVGIVISKEDITNKEISCLTDIPLFVYLSFVFEYDVA